MANKCCPFLGAPQDIEDGAAMEWWYCRGDNCSIKEALHNVHWELPLQSIIFSKNIF